LNAGEVAGAEETAAETTAEEIKRINNLLVEEKKKIQNKLNERAEKYKSIFVDRLITMVDNEPKPIENTKIYNKNLKINEGINNMINDIDDMLKE
jgi:adenosyl cobinamide kinase/adenosyl cobinamide phosphate guanylyltransferase